MGSFYFHIVYERHLFHTEYFAISPIVYITNEYNNKNQRRPATICSVVKSPNVGASTTGRCIKSDNPYFIVQKCLKLQKNSEYALGAEGEVTILKIARLEMKKIHLNR